MAKPVGVTRQQDVLQQSSHLFESDAISNFGQSVILGHCSLNNMNLYKTKQNINYNKYKKTKKQKYGTNKQKTKLLCSQMQKQISAHTTTERA